MGHPGQANAAGEVYSWSGTKLTFETPGGGGSGIFLGDGFGASQPLYNSGLSVNNGQRSVKFIAPRNMRITGAYFNLITIFGGAPNVWWAIYKQSDGSLVGGVWHGLNPPSTGWLWVPAAATVDLTEGEEYWIFGHTQGTMAEMANTGRCAVNNFGSINQTPFSTSAAVSDRAPPVCLRGIAIP